MSRCSAMVVLAFIGIHARAAVLVYEGFDYPTGNIVGRTATGTGLARSWDATVEAGSTAEVTGSSLSMPGHFPGIGGALTYADHGAPYDEKALGVGISAILTGHSVLYVSSLIQVDSQDGNFWHEWVVEHRIHSGHISLWADNNADGPGLRMLGRTYGSGTRADSRGGVGANYSEVREDLGTVAPSTPYLMVARFEVDPGSSLTTGGEIWFLEALGYAHLQAALKGGAALDSPLLDLHAHVHLSDPEGGFDLSGTRYLQYVIQGGPIGTFDELRIATELADVVCETAPPPTEPPFIIRQPEDVLGVVGNEVIVSLEAHGPWHVEWFKNGVSTASGFDQTYRFVGTETDKNAAVYAIVSNEIGAVTSEVVTITLDDPAPPQLCQGFLRGEHYGDFPGAVVWPDVYNDLGFQQGAFDYSFFTFGGDVPGAGVDHFARKVQGWVSPRTSGDYTFHIRSDDASELFINPDGGTAGALPVLPDGNLHETNPDALETNCCNPFQEFGQLQTSGLFPLTQGMLYGITVVYKEHEEDDYLQVAMRRVGDTTPAADLLPIPRELCYCLASPAGRRARITQHPLSQTVPQSRAATFNVAVEILPRDGDFGIQWTRNGLSIPGATDASYTTDPADMTYDGAVYQAKVFTLAGLRVSDPATLTVTPDATPPSAESAGVFPDGTLLGISYDETLDPGQVTNPDNYIVSGTVVTAAELVGNDDAVVLLALSGPPAVGGTVTYENSRDLVGNVGSGMVTIEEPDLTPATLVNDLSDPVKPGRAAYLGGGGYYVEAGGSDIWDTRDAGFMVTTMWSGAFDMRVCVQSLAGSHEWTKAGIMMRDAADGGARHVALMATRTGGENVYQHQWRDTPDTECDDIDQDHRRGPVTYPNAWLRLVREDSAANVFRSFLSTDGVTWTHYFDHTIPGPVLPETLLIGMAATAHDNSEGADPAEAVFRSFSIQPFTVVDPPYITAIGIVGDQLEVHWLNGGELGRTDDLKGAWNGTGETNGTLSELLSGLDPTGFYGVNTGD